MSMSNRQLRLNSLETELERKVVSAFEGIVDTLFKVEDGAGRQEEKSKTIEKKGLCDRGGCWSRGGGR